MQYVKIRDLALSKFTLGTVQLGMNYGIVNRGGKPNQAKINEILSAAEAGGINSFDTSLHYGDSEIVIGNYLSSDACSIKDTILTTKFKISKEDILTSSDVEKQIYGFVEQSLKRLKVNRIQIYMLHNPQDMFMYGRAIPDTLKKLQKDGLIDKAAVSVYNIPEIEKMLENDVYEAVQIPMNIIDKRIIKSGILKKLHDANKIVFVRSIFLQGLFFMNPSQLTGNLQAAKEPIKALINLAEKEGISIAQLALSYIRDMQEVTSLVIGAETPEQVRENIKLIEGPGISEKTKYEIENLFNDIPKEILNPGLWKV